MDIQHPNSAPASAGELKNLAKLKAAVEKAVADGVLTQDEEQRIKAIAWEDGKITPEELHIVQTLIWDKLQQGELELSD
ncbi:MAG: hypothetical protein IGS50_15375 [Synechococcales cyanobacterium C42_A2020_086]|jgi:tellurite resistance protein|nr:hypothetical protein [Synechococcales cyanobacterium C42_A2020_086]